MLSVLSNICYYVFFSKRVGKEALALTGLLFSFALSNIYLTFSSKSSINFLSNLSALAISIF